MIANPKIFMVEIAKVHQKMGWKNSSGEPLKF